MPKRLQIDLAMTVLPAAACLTPGAFAPDEAVTDEAARKR
jgi:hypothetical protein